MVFMAVYMHAYLLTCVKLNVGSDCLKDIYTPPNVSIAATSWVLKLMEYYYLFRFFALYRIVDFSTDTREKKKKPTAIVYLKKELERTSENESVSTYDFCWISSVIWDLCIKQNVEMSRGIIFHSRFPVLAVLQKRKLN